jgi:hypothetical protein
VCRVSWHKQWLLANLLVTVLPSLKHSQIQKQMKSISTCKLTVQPSHIIVLATESQKPYIIDSVHVLTDPQIRKSSAGCCYTLASCILLTLNHDIEGANDLRVQPNGGRECA